ncbi:hypothetical protein CLV43_107173 [Umezawaea tangerina]|uniref:Uncharacterized protein n=1 Tax=Umezawaea tangerina TaxID=84725 RepID=A0A2T0T1R7_9PSEU|nr:hypothetical protein CLV43_107173 [Umezawaea tangerina]
MRPPAAVPVDADLLDTPWAGLAIADAGLVPSC